MWQTVSLKKPTAWTVVYPTAMAVACFISCRIDTDLLASFLETPSVSRRNVGCRATVFVFKETRATVSLQA
jgi:hypothetical protein